MAFNKSGATASEMLSGLKSRLGFSHADDEDDEFSRYDADFNDYDDFDDEYDDRYDDEREGFESRSSGRSNGAAGSTGGFRAASTRSSRFGHPDSTPNLVSIDDVREHSKSLIESSRGSYEQAHRSDSGNSRLEGARRRSAASGRNLIEADGPAPSSPAYAAAQREASSRSEGLNSLFESTSSRENRYASASSVNGQRGLTVIKPLSYNDVEGVARALKAGDAVVLAMGNTPDDLFRRILDFSFGVASALEASVDCPAPKVYALVRGNDLTEEEKARLQTQGVL